MATYVAALRELAEHCSYGTTLAEMLRDHLVCGINHEVIQRKQKNLTYESAYSLAQSIETAEHDSKHIKTGGAAGTTEKPLHFARNPKGHRPPDTGSCHLLQIWWITPSPPVQTG